MTMNKTGLIILSTVVFCFVAGVACGAEKEVRFHVKGLECARSELAFTDLFKTVDGVGKITTDVAEGTATIVFDDEKTGVEKMTGQIEKGDFKVRSSEMLR